MLSVYALRIGPLEQYEELAKSNRYRGEPCVHLMKGGGLAEYLNLTL